MSHDNMMSVKEAANFLDVTERTVRNYIKKGLLCKRKRGRATLLETTDVLSLREDMESSAPVVTRQEILRQRAKIRRLESHMEVVLRILDAKDAPLNISPSYAEDLYGFAVEHLKKKSWDLSEISPWIDIFDRLSEDDLTTVSKAVGETHPWRAFLKLCTAMMAHVVQDSQYATSLELQGVHRALASSRRKLRVTSFIYGEMIGGLDADLAGFGSAPKTTSDALFGKILKNR